MPLNTPGLLVTPRVGAEQYDGTNSAHIAGCLTDGSVNSANGSTCNIQVGEGFSFDLPLDHWLIIQNGAFAGLKAPEEFDPAYVVIMSAQEVTALSESDPISAVGVASVPTLGALSQQTVSVTLHPTMGDTSYDAAPVLAGTAALLANLTILSHSVVDESTVDVVVRNNGLASAAGAKLAVVVVD